MPTRQILRDQNTIRKIVRALKKSYAPEKIILFGSHASGTAHANSDIDLLIVKETRQPFFRRMATVRRLVCEARQGYPLDPIVVTPLELRNRIAHGDQFFKQILSKGSVLYAGN